MNKAPTQKENTVLKIFNYLGGTFIFLGISYFVFANWDLLNDFTKIFTTLGSGIAAFILGMLLHASKKHDAASAAFFMLAGLLLPIGMHVTFEVLQCSWNIDTRNLFVSAVCLGIFLAALLLSPRTIFLFFTIVFASLFYLSVNNFLLSNILVSPHFAHYQIMALGVSYILLGYFLDNTKYQALTGPLYFFGCLFTLATSFCLGSIYLIGYSIKQWEIITPILILLTFVLSVPLRSKSFLYLGVIFLLLYIGDIAIRFINIFGEFGWSLILVIAGILLMVIGYLVIFLHKKIRK